MPRPFPFLPARPAAGASQPARVAPAPLFRAGRPPVVPAQTITRLSGQTVRRNFLDIVERGGSRRKKKKSAAPAPPSNQYQALTDLLQALTGNPITGTNAGDPFVPGASATPVNVSTGTADAPTGIDTTLILLLAGGVVAVVLLLKFIK